MIYQKSIIYYSQNGATIKNPHGKLGPHLIQKYDIQLALSAPHKLFSNLQICNFTSYLHLLTKLRDKN